MGTLVRDIVKPRALVVPPDMSTREAGWFMLQRSIGLVPVVDAEGHLTGVLSRTDLLRSGYAGGMGEREIHTRHQKVDVAGLEVTLEHAEPRPPRAGDVPVSAAMTNVAFRVGLDASCHEAARTMRNGRIHHLLVMEDERLVGVLSPLDLLGLVER